ncbi:MAG: aminoglycoside phosphotransferase family protein, partial [Mesorhizobium sp.]
RAWDLGFIAWRWVPFWRDTKCRAHGLPTGVAEKARRYRLLLHAYGFEPEVGVLQAGIERVRQFQEHMWKLVANGS